MSGLADGLTGKGRSRPQAIAAMAAPLNRSTAARYAAPRPNSRGAAAGADVDVFQAKNGSSLCGATALRRRGPRALAHQHGIAHALSQGYDRRGSGILQALSAHRPRRA